jgi:hypothetical protein
MRLARNGAQFRNVRRGARGAPLPENLAVSCSWPSGNRRTVIGECWVAEASRRGYVEVFIRPVLD